MSVCRPMSDIQVDYSLVAVCRPIPFSVYGTVCLGTMTYLENCETKSVSHDLIYAIAASVDLVISTMHYSSGF